MNRKRWDALCDRLPQDRPIVGAEVGVWDGRMSEQLLKRLPLLTLYMVDRWEPPQPDDTYYNSGSSYAREPSDVYHDALERALKRTNLYAGRRRIIVAESESGAQKVSRHELDFAFIDADHSYAGVMRDLKAWISRVNPSGLIGGHDYAHPEQGEVKRAVDEFFADWPGVIELDANHTWFYQLPETL